MTTTARPELIGTFGMVSSTHWLASSAGMATLEAGGNAFDAAVASGLTLAVVEPHLNGPGGEVSIVSWSAQRDRPLVVCGQGPAPRAATIEGFRQLGLSLVPGTGLLPACVPASFDAWMLLLRDFGTMRLSDVMQYAIHYAAGGFPVVPGIRRTLEGVQELFLEAWQDSADLWLPGGRPPEVGSLHRNPPLAATLRRILVEAESHSGDRDEQIEAARDVFLRGFVAEEIVAFVEAAPVLDSSGTRHRGLLAAEDLAGYQASVEAPASIEYRGVTVCKTGPWGQGPVLLQQLALLEAFDLASMGRCSAELIHTVVECAKLAFADREAWYGDPDWEDVGLDVLLSGEYADQRRALVSSRASLELRPGTVHGRTPRVPLAHAAASVTAATTGLGEPTVARAGERRGDTCHVSVADRHGNLVACTPSGGWLQSSPAIPSLGFCLGTRGQMFALEEGLPSSLAPGKRPRTTLSPSLALRDGGPSIAFGTPGGDQQDQWGLLFLLSCVDFGMNLQEAIEAPAFHTTHFPSSFYPRTAEPGRVEIEGRIDPGVVRELERRGHRVVVADPWSLGRLSAVSSSNGVLRAGANPRGMQGYAVGR